MDLSGKVAIVTGANSGIGLYILLHLVRQGAKVYLAARSEEKANDAIARLEKEGLGPNAGEIVWLKFDLTDPAKAKQAAEWILGREERLDILVNNAGKIMSPYGKTADGLSDSMVINHLGPFLFTRTLLPLLESTARQPGSDVRIVNVSSMAHRWISKPRYNSLEALNSDFSHTWKPQATLYAYTKLANILCTNQLQKRFDNDGIPIVAVSVHPGSVMSEGNIKLFTSLTFGTLINWVFSLFFISSLEGGYTPAWAAAAREVHDNRERYKAKYLVPYGKIEEASQDARSEELAAELWQTTESALSDYNWI